MQRNIITRSDTKQAVMKKIEIRTSPVELFKILKFEGLAESGGAAKSIIADGRVMLNGKKETQKRKKIVAGDTLEFDGESYRIIEEKKS